MIVTFIVIMHHVVHKHRQHNHALTMFLTAMKQSVHVVANAVMTSIKKPHHVALTKIVQHVKKIVAENLLLRVQIASKNSVHVVAHKSGFVANH